MIQTLLDTCTRWEQDACSVLHDTECLLNCANTDDKILSRFGKIEKQIQAIESVVEAGQGLGFKFDMVPKLEDACSTLRWCFRALSFATAIPTLEVIICLIRFLFNLKRDLDNELRFWLYMHSLLLGIINVILLVFFGFFWYPVPKFLFLAPYSASGIACIQGSTALIPLACHHHGI